MDITYQSVALILKRLEDSEGQAAFNNVELHGVPKDIELVDALIHKKDDCVSKEIGLIISLFRFSKRGNCKIYEGN